MTAITPHARQIRLRHQGIQPRLHELRLAVALIEVLVALGILALLLALILPAILKVREASNSLVCGNNLRQLGHAAHLYHQSHNKLPPGYLGPSLRNNSEYPNFYYEGQWLGHFPLLLPFLDVAGTGLKLEASFKVDFVSDEPWFRKAGVLHEANALVGLHDLRFFKCPSAQRFHPIPGKGTTALGIHVAHSADGWIRTVWWGEDYLNRPHLRYLATTNYLGSAGTGRGNHPFWRVFEGVYVNRSELNLAQLSQQDGTSNVILYGETCGSRSQGSPPFHHDVCWIAAGSLGTYSGLQRGDDADLTSFSSYHPRGVRLCFADGSVRAARHGTTVWDQTTTQAGDWLVLQQLGGRRDGARTEASTLLD